eukprot:CAMPEP_0173340760 /NCGR_PEP_ID=MMETSP1144-20121109/9169_1 /TAXON_ID=483371 /ORGANISM="non described non described, Strain CCMP2298" /LENGTH=166 /DNA_ID=CAMNT_0014286955 /DNA_START=67 /DNA_END=567 /DNA_ORIENTATION=+
MLLGVNAFCQSKMNQFAQRRALNALEPEVLAKLDEIKGKYDRVVNVDSAEANAESAMLKEVAEKYGTYVEIKKLIIKIRTMYIDEASDARKAKQLKSFVDLYKGKVELEQILREKAGFPTIKGMAEGLSELAALDAQLASLQAKLDKAEIKIPEGMSTRFARFGTP